MADYANLVKDLRCHAGTCKYKETECSRYNKMFDGISYTTCSQELCDDAADAIEELIADRDKALKRLCEWCGVCSEENRKALECDDIAMLDAPQWISVEDELPETGKVVLLCVNCEEAKPHTGFLAADGWFMHDVLGDMRRSKWKVTHWMPLPKAPEPPEGVE